MAGCILYLCLRLLDAVEHHPVHKQAVEKVVRKAQEAVHLRLDIRLDGHVAQLGAEAAELDLQGFDLVLRAVQMAVLGKVGNQPAAEHVKGTPVARAVQARKDAFRRVAGGAAGVDRLFDLARLRPLRGDFLLELQNALGLPGAACLECFALVRKHLLVPRFAALKRAQLAFIPCNVLPDGFQLAYRTVVPDRSGIGLLLFLVQLLVLSAEHAVKQRGKAAPFQTVDVLLLGGAHGGEFLFARFEFAAAGIQRIQHGMQLLLPRGLRAQRAKLIIKVCHGGSLQSLSG